MKYGRCTWPSDWADTVTIPNKPYSDDGYATTPCCVRVRERHRATIPTHCSGFAEDQHDLVLRESADELAHVVCPHNG